jgi:hypothetical protein
MNEQIQVPKWYKQLSKTLMGSLSLETPKQNMVGKDSYIVHEEKEAETWIH